ncbi:adenosine deaminase [Kocuria sp. WRN011]|uniref:adenosine deaminase n=1 Tax=Kocuria TaxID=57493 RepID=UPI000BAED47A|nr:adenosine deaminase [Kocuria sp. WRN011]PBB09387.1 adenosine deaminase [Kocuria sp. WRN011]
MRQSTSTEGSVRAMDGALGPIPAVCLHDHLDGALRPATIVELAREINHELPETDPVALGRWFEDSANSGSLERYLTTFEHTTAVMQTAEALARVAEEYVLDCAADGLIHTEVRWAPEQHLVGGLTLEQAVDAVQDGLARGVAEVKASGGHISAVQILCAMRHLDKSGEIAQLVVDRVRAAAGTTSPGDVPGEPAPGSVVAFDLAGPEKGFPASDHRQALHLLTENLVPVTLHAGEADGAESIRDALVSGRALRIGHGVRLLEDDPEATGPLSRWVRDRHIALEVCPCSNLQTGAISHWGESIKDHPITQLHRSGFTVTLSPDNRLMSATSVSHEMSLLLSEAGWSNQDLADIQLNAARAAFVPRAYQDWLAERIEEASA